MGFFKKSPIQQAPAIKIGLANKKAEKTKKYADSAKRNDLWHYPLLLRKVKIIASINGRSGDGKYLHPPRGIEHETL